MKRGSHLLATELENVKGGCEGNDIVTGWDQCSVGGHSTQEIEGSPL